MIAEELGQLIADHLRQHIKSYLDAEAAKHDDQVQLVVPKSIETASTVGGTISQFARILPSYGIDVLQAQPGTDSNGLWTENYAGQINGLVSGSSAAIVDKLGKRHAAAVLAFVDDHFNLHAGTYTGSEEYLITEFSWVALEFAGAELIDESNNSPVWINAFSLNVVIQITTAHGPRNHA